MSQTAALQDMASDMFDAFVDAGFADTAIYTAPGGAWVNCRAAVTIGVQPFGDFGSVSAGQNTVDLLLSEIPTPQARATVTVDGRTFRLVKLLKQDQAVSTWAVENG